MNTNNAFTKGWNIFARELATILASHNIQLQYLHEEVPIFPDKIRRLVISLSEPNNFPVLREDELIAVGKACQLSTTEMLQLRAAFLATTVEKSLLEHVSPESALQAGQAILPIIFASLQQEGYEADALERGDGFRGDLFLGKNNSGLEVVEEAWEAYDNAEMALQLSNKTDRPAERLLYMRQAVQQYEVAFRKMEQANKSVRNMRVWKDWYTEIQSNLAEARTRLKILER